MLSATADPCVRATERRGCQAMDRLKHAPRAVRARLGGLASRLLRRTEGNVAMMFGMALPVLVMITFGAIDIHQASKVKANLQDALDAAALAAARSTYTDDADINRVGLAALKANMPGYFAEESQDTASFVLTGNRVTGDARVNVKVLVANIVLPPYGKLLDDYLPVSSRSEVLRASRNVEVAMALDVTGSMRGQPLIDLKEAAIELIGIVVQDQQSPFTSKAALAPYAAGVNLGDAADGARGSIPPALANITGLDWKTGAAKAISGVTRANPAVISASNHGFAVGDYVWISEVRGMRQLNDRALEVTKTTSNSLEVRVPGQSGSLDSRDYSRYTSDGKIQKCLQPDCSLRVTAAGHGRSTGDYVWIDEVQGMTEVNKSDYRVTRVDANVFTIPLYAPDNAYTGGGGVFCVDRGCRAYRFANANGGTTTYEVTTCVSERTGGQAYTDASPATARVGRSYITPSSCPDQPVTPLSSQRPYLEDRINALKDGGSTAGQIGIAWAWYLVSPNFASLFGEGRPEPYDRSKTLKAVVLMTDGEFNTPFCNDVIARDAGSGSGGAATHINCDATNGNPFSQAVQLCAAMKGQDVVVYTVGFNLSTNRGKSGVDTAIEVMETCATNKDTHFFNANSGTDLKEAFKAIGRDITRLRIAR